MLCAGRTKSGTHLWPRWWTFLFGGLHHSKPKGGYDWRPSCFRLAYRYYREGWYESHQGYWNRHVRGLWKFIKM